MVVIRLARGGKKNQPFYRVVVADSRRARDGRCLELLGYYNPSPKGNAIPAHLKMERYYYWISQGAQPSPRVSQLVKHLAKLPDSTLIN